MKKYFLLTLLLSVIAHSSFAQQIEDRDKPTISISYPPYIEHTTDSKTGKVIGSLACLDYSSTFVSINVPSVGSTEDIEYTVDPISIPLHHPASLTATMDNQDSLTVSVSHRFMHSSSYYFFKMEYPHQDLVNFTFTNRDAISHLLVQPPQFRSNIEPYFSILAPGEVTLDFSYTKTTPSHREGWSWVPEKKATTIVHVPIKIVDISSQTDTSKTSSSTASANASADSTEDSSS